MSFNQKFYIYYIYIIPKSATPFLMGVTLESYIPHFKYLSQLLTKLDETNGIQSEILHTLNIHHF